MIIALLVKGYYHRCLLFLALSFQAILYCHSFFEIGYDYISISKKMFRQIFHFFASVDKFINIIPTYPYTISHCIHKLITISPQEAVDNRTVVLEETI